MMLLYSKGVKLRLIAKFNSEVAKLFQNDDRTENGKEKSSIGSFWDFCAHFCCPGLQLNQ